MNENESQQSAVCKLTKGVLKIQQISGLRRMRIGWAYSICFLKDKRLVTIGQSDYNEAIMVYDHLYQTQFQIKNAHDDEIYSFCVLTNGDLVSGSLDKMIKISE